MPKYCGITKDPGSKREEHKKKFSKVRNWKVVVKFQGKVDAEDWRDAQEGYEKEMDGYHGGVGVEWFGYKFDYGKEGNKESFLKKLQEFFKPLMSFKKQG